MGSRIVAFSDTLSQLVVLLGLALSLSLSASAARAGSVTFAGASGPGLASMSFNTVNLTAPGNDNVAGASPNEILINQKAFGSVGVIDMLFLVDSTGIGTTEYQLFEGVSNGTGTDWIGYQVRLGFGTGGSFVPSTFGDGLDFDFPDEDSPVSFGVFGSVVVGEDVINATGGPMLDTSFDNFAFAIDVPDDIGQFTVRQEPRVIPEPGTAMLLMLGLGALGARARAR